MDMNNMALAADRLREAIEIYHALGNTRGEMRNLRNLAEVEAATEHLETASRLLDRLDAYLAKEPNERLAMFVAATRVSIANSRHDLPLADREATRAIELAKKNDNQHLLAVMTNLMSSIRYRQKRYAEAAQLAESAIELSRAIPVEFKVANEKAASAYEKLGRSADAKRALQAAIDSIEGELANVPGTEDDKQTFYEDKSTPYLGMFRLLAAEHQPEKAIEWVERSRSRSLIEYLGRTKSAPERHDAGELQREQALVKLNRDLRELYAAPARDGETVARLEKDLREKRLDLQDYQARLYSKYPHMALERGALPRPTFAEVQKLIPKNGAILQYVVDEDFTWIVVIRSSGRPYIRKIPIDARQLHARMTAFFTRVARRDLGIRAESRRLYDLFVKPAEPALQGKTSLCIIPDSLLWELPFQSLVDGKGRYFIERRTMFYAPSLSLLAWYASHPRASQAKEDVLVMANPQLSSQTTRMARAVRRGESMGPLPEAEDEARAIKAMYGSEATVVIGSDATEAFLKRNANRYRIIHLATHAVFDNTSPLHSHLLLAAGKDSAEDGLLEAREIMNLDLAPDLVILSSCETGRGEVRGGDGLVGMSWALLVAGCPTAVVSQWKVGSAGTEKLMTEFHKRLSKLPPDRRRAGAARSLRAADLALMQMPEYRYPYDWSAFVVIGNGW
jgi:CHAT domain-containing protein